MSFNATNFTVSILLLMVLTVFMAGVRLRKPLENNWVFLYWILLTVATITRAEEIFDFRVIAVGLAAGLLLRFEFMNRQFAGFVMFVELLVFGYILYAGFILITSA